MKPIAQKNFSFNGIFYNVDDEVSVKTKEELIKLNEKGFIYPLTNKEIQDYFKKSETKKINKKEEE